jgi:hypothetical protein
MTAGERRRNRGRTPVGRVRCADGVERDVYQDADGRQYVVGEQGEKVFGLWLPGAAREDTSITDAEADRSTPTDDEPASSGETPWERPGSVRRDSESHRGRLLSLLGTVSFCCGVVAVCFAPAGVVGLLLGLWVRGAARRDLGKIDTGTMDPDGAAQTRAALADANLSLVLSGIGLLLGTALAVALAFVFF